MIGEIRGLGAMLGFTLERPDGEPAADETKEMVGYSHENGLILLSCGTYGNVIRTLIPFVITEDQLEKGLNIMEKGLESLHK